MLVTRNYLEIEAMNRCSTSLGVLGFFALVSVPVHADYTFNGALTVGSGGLTASEDWTGATTQVAYTASMDSTTGRWTYTYTFTPASLDGSTPSEISHMMVEVSDGDVSIFDDNNPATGGGLDEYTGSSTSNTNPVFVGDEFSWWGFKWDELSGTSFTGYDHYGQSTNVG